MHSARIRRPVALAGLLAILFLEVSSPVSVPAKWRDRSDDLPGLSTGDVLKIALPLAAAGALLMVVLSSGGDTKGSGGDAGADSTAAEADSLGAAALEERRPDSAVRFSWPTLTYDPNRQEISVQVSASF